MTTLSDYRITGQIYESADSIIYKGLRNTDNLPIVIKLLKKEYPAPEELAVFRREYEIARMLKGDGIIEVYALEKYKNSLMD